MASIPANSSDWSREHADDREQRLNQIIADYLEAHEAGQPTDRGALLKQYPDLAAELALFFANQDHVGQLTAPLRDGNRPSFSARVGSSTRSRFPDLGQMTCSDPITHPSSETRVRYFGDYELIEILRKAGWGSSTKPGR